MSARVRSGSRRTNRRGGHGFILALAMGTSLAVLAATLALVLRWPGPSSAPDAPSLPISVGGLVFNVPPAAIRLPLQRRAGAQGRLDRLFVTIAALDDTLGPVERIKSIYPRYFDFGRFAGPDGLLVIRFRDGTPYQAEDLFYDPAAPEHFVARCSRPGAGPTPGICLLERRLAEAAEITVRFPRDWLVDWRRLSAGIDRLIASLRPSSS